MGGFLNPAGRITLLKLVLQSITAYQLASLDPPVSVIKLLERLFSNFFWGSVDGKNKSHWVAWQVCCRSTEEGGLGIPSSSDMVKAFSIKLWWRFRTQKSCWLTSRVPDTACLPIRLRPLLEDPIFGKDWSKLKALQSLLFTRW